jgi:hypothetical protein
MILAPLSWPSNPGLATMILIFIFPAFIPLSHFSRRRFS